MIESAIERLIKTNPDMEIWWGLIPSDLQQRG